MVGSQSSPPSKRKLRLVSEDPQDEEDMPEKKRRAGLKLEDWPEPDRRKVMVYAVRELSKWAILGDPLPSSADLTVKLFAVWKEALSMYPSSGFKDCPGKKESTYVSNLEIVSLET